MTDEDGNSDSSEHVVNVTATPVARFTVSTLTPMKGQTVTFTDTSFDPDGSIALRAWKISGVLVSDAATFAHVFTERGTHAIQLTVTDNDGVPASRFENVTVQNVKPTAAFTVSPATVIVGEATSFTSTSTDPDGSLVAAKTSWTLESTTIRPSPDPALLTYVFTTGGVKSVALSVEDDAGATASTSKNVVVYSSAAASWSVAVRYADGTIGPVDGTANFYNNRDQTTKSIANGAVTQDATNGRMTLSLTRGAWVAGDTYVVSGVIRGRSYTFTYTAVASDAGANRQVGLVVLPKFLAEPVIAVAPGEVEGELGFLPNLVDLGVTPGTYYASTTEPIHGTVTGRWSSPAGIATGATVQVWMNRSLTGVNRIPLINGPDIPVLGLIQKVEGTTDAAGEYDFEMPLLLLDHNPPGWYTLDALLSWPVSIGPHIAPTRATVFVYVDVEGLFEAVVGMAVP